jgi:hypothetical protein
MIVVTANDKYRVHMASHKTSNGGRRDRVRMVVGVTTTYIINAYHH